MRRATSLVILVAATVAGCTGGSSVVHSAERSPSSSQAHQPLSARIELSSTSVLAGSTLTGRVVVQNDTGHTLFVSACGSPFAVALGNDEIRPSVAWAACLQGITIPRGTSSWPVTVPATYLACGNGAHLVPCDHRRPPALPPGSYEARLYQSSKVVPEPVAVQVRVFAS